MSESRRPRVLEPFTDAPLILVDATECIESITHALQWPEELFCGGQPNQTLSEDGVTLLRGMLPTIRAQTGRVRNLYLDIPSNHPSHGGASEVLKALESGLLILEAVAARCESGVADAIGLPLAREAFEAARARTSIRHAAV